MSKENSAVFIGHRRCQGLNEKRLSLYIQTLLMQGVDTFYNGGMGQFDRVAARAVYDLKRIYPEIKSYIVVPYQNFRVFNRNLFDEVIMPFEEQRESNVYYVSAIPKRNHYMVDNAAYALCYVTGAPGGATNTYLYAKEKNLKLLNLYKPEL